MGPILFNPSPDYQIEVQGLSTKTSGLIITIKRLLRVYEIPNNRVRCAGSVWERRKRGQTS